MARKLQKKTATVKIAQDQEPDEREWRALSEADYAILNLIIRYPALTDQEIADRIGYSRGYVNRRRNSPEVRYEMYELQRDVIEKIKDIQIKAVRRLERIVDGGADRDAKTAAATIIDGLPEVAAGLAKPHDDGDEPTQDELEAIESHLAEIKKRKAADEGGAT